MILEMKVPSPGESITEVEIATWLVSDGDYVEKDQAIAEVDSDKATLELPAEASGIITLKAEEGDAVAVGQVVCLIDTSAEVLLVLPKVSHRHLQLRLKRLRSLIQRRQLTQQELLHQRLQNS
jgi:pyruvate/2-oxoglutarate dehydrogenase complex dihydrolipoamide acyltransferase (E2) component